MLTASMRDCLALATQTQFIIIFDCPTKSIKICSEILPGNFTEKDTSSSGYETMLHVFQDQLAPLQLRMAIQFGCCSIYR